MGHLAKPMAVSHPDYAGEEVTLKPMGFGIRIGENSNVDAKVSVCTQSRAKADATDKDSHCGGFLAAWPARGEYKEMI